MFQNNSELTDQYNKIKDPENGTHRSTKCIGTIVYQHEKNK